MATLFKNENSPIWRARFTDANGRRVSKSTGTTKKSDAKKIAAGFEVEEHDHRKKAVQLPAAFAVIVEAAAREAAQGELTLARAQELIGRLYKIANPDHAEISLGDFWKAWITEQKRHVTHSTAQGYGEDHKLFAAALGPRIMNAQVSELTAAQINTAIDKAKKTGTRRASTINKALASLRRVMEDAVSKRLATHNPAKQCRSLSQIDSIERAPFEVSEIRAMLTHKETTDEWRGAITIAAHTGLRLGDVLSLSDKHVDGTRIVIMPSKTSRQKKVIEVPLTPPCLAWIKGKKGSFFPTLQKQQTATTSMQFHAIMKKAKVPKIIEKPGGIKANRSFHSLRHTFASWLAEQDIHADVRQKLTGHSSSGIHARYTHHDAALDRAVAVLPSL